MDVMDKLRALANVTKFEIHAFVVMPDHIHILRPE